MPTGIYLTPCEWHAIALIKFSSSGLTQYMSYFDLLRSLKLCILLPSKDFIWCSSSIVTLNPSCWYSLHEQRECSPVIPDATPVRMTDSCGDANLTWQMIGSKLVFVIRLSLEIRHWLLLICIRVASPVNDFLWLRFSLVAFSCLDEWCFVWQSTNWRSITLKACRRRIFSGGNRKRKTKADNYICHTRRQA